MLQSNIDSEQIRWSGLSASFIKGSSYPQQACLTSEESNLNDKVNDLHSGFPLTCDVS